MKLIDENRYADEMRETVLPALATCRSEGWMAPADDDGLAANDADAGTAGQVDTDAHAALDTGDRAEAAGDHDEHPTSTAPGADDASSDPETQADEEDAGRSKIQ